MGCGSGGGGGSKGAGREVRLQPRPMGFFMPAPPSPLGNAHEDGYRQGFQDGFEACLQQAHGKGLSLANRLDGKCMAMGYPLASRLDGRLVRRAAAWAEAATAAEVVEDAARRS